MIYFLFIWGCYFGYSLFGAVENAHLVAKISELE